MSSSNPRPAALADKMPQLTLWFWIMKIAATTLGETAGDHFSKTMHLGYAQSTQILMGIFAALLFAQLLVRRHVPTLYWLVILATSTAGTTMSDYMDRTLGLGYALGSAILVASLLLILLIWRVLEGSLSVTRIHTRRGEVFYWGAILISNTLGTALGDYLADDSGLGFAGGAGLIGGILVLIAALYAFTGVSRIGLFWAAFILTRPFGATLGDVLMRPHDQGGLDFGTSGSSLVLAGILVILVARATWRLRRAARA